MKERAKYRSYLVTWDGYRQTNHMTQQEMEEKILEGNVDNVLANGHLDQFEIAVYKTKLLMESQEEGFHAGNKEIAQHISQILGDDISRGQIARARDSIRIKLGFK